VLGVVAARRKERPGFVAAEMHNGFAGSAKAAIENFQKSGRF